MRSAACLIAGSRGGKSSQSSLHRSFAELCGEVANLLFVAAAVVVQGLPGGSQLLLLGFQLLFAFDKLPGLLLDARLAGCTPVADFLPFGGHQLMLHLQPLSELDELFLLFRQRFLFLFELLAQLQA